MIALIPVSLVLFLVSLSSAAIAVDNGKIPVLRIDAHNKTPHAIGISIGRQSKALFADIERRYDSHLATLLSQGVFNRIQRLALPALLQSLDTTHYAELEGIASVWSMTSNNIVGDGRLSMDEFHVLNLLPDIVAPVNGVGFGVLKQASATQTPIIGRNVDWHSSAELRSLQAIIVYQYEDKAWVNIGFAGIVSVISGFNQQGLFLAHFNANPYSPYHTTQVLNAGVKSSVFELRKALENSVSVKQAARYLAANHYPINLLTLMADKKTLQVLESPQTGKAQRRNENSATHSNKMWGRKQQMAIIDCHILATLHDNCSDANDNYRWQRLRKLAVFNAKHPADVQDMGSLLFDHNNRLFEIFNANTLQSMVYVPEKMSLYLYTAPVTRISHNSLESVQHKAYFNLISSELQQHEKNNQRYFMGLIGFLVLVMVVIMVWVVRRNNE